MAKRKSVETSSGMAVDEPVPDLSDVFIQVRLTTKSSKFALPDVPYSLPGVTKSADLNIVINQLLGEYAAEQWIPVEFDFLINGEILLQSVGEYIYERKIPSENVLEIEYIEHLPAPEPEASLDHPDWVSAVQMLDDCILTGCYDNQVRVWTRKGALVLAHAAHISPVRAVAWVNVSDTEGSFLTSSHDQTVALWSLENRKTQHAAVTPKAFYRGHAASVDGLAVSPDAQKFCSVSFDKMVKIWSLSDTPSVESEETVEPAEKKLKGDGKKLTKTPEATLSGHKEAVSCCAWTAPSEIITASWDHSIKIWDVELGGMSRQLDGTKAFLSISYSPLSKLLISGATDRIVRLYDPRSNEGSIVKIGFASHMGWVSSVAWSPTNENLFISASYDKLMKMWDVRSPKSPVYDMAGHSDKILCSAWSNTNLLLSGGADNDLKMFSADV
ncbi:Ribosome biogenesis protein WDR12-like protein [Hypsibius exemplaris]|uniref:Ribosome biogenesis protein WDR12 homolog n=1 Tax=Hypsibius exemplaris TaxID=2072580 RepID=A0A1W0WD41_HYPEX|nr:Ribosome biogenesis protein WDR12-like protein [Hypsibius exemplaris]